MDYQEPPPAYYYFVYDDDDDDDYEGEHNHEHYGSGYGPYKICFEPTPRETQSTV